MAHTDVVKGYEEHEENRELDHEEKKLHVTWGARKLDRRRCIVAAFKAAWASS